MNETAEVPKTTGVSVVMPMRNGASTVRRSLESLLEQAEPFDELIVVDDKSTDDSVRIARKTLQSSGHTYLLVEHERSEGLACSYNDGIRRASGELIVTMHCDVVLQGEKALGQLVAPLRKNRDVVLAYHCVDHPRSVWETYNFWQKCFFARQVGRRQSGMDGKFDCLRKSALEEVGLFDGETFRRAGEDGDVFRKLAAKGETVKTDSAILHLHSLDPDFRMSNIIYKHAQYAESQGAILRRYGCTSLRECARAFFREIMVLMLLVPGIRLVALALIVAYSVAYCSSLYSTEWKNGRIILVPFLNIVLLLVSCAFSVRGFARGRQTL